MWSIEENLSYRIFKFYWDKQDNIADRYIQLIKSEHSLFININNDVINWWIHTHSFWTRFQCCYFYADTKTCWVSAQIQLKEQHSEYTLSTDFYIDYWWVWSTWYLLMFQQSMLSTMSVIWVCSCLLQIMMTGSDNIKRERLNYC